LPPWHGAPMHSEPSTPGARRLAAVQIAVVLAVMAAWLTGMKAAGAQELLRAHLPRAWIYVSIAGNGTLGLAVLAVVLRLSREGWGSVGLSRTEPFPAIGWGLLAAVPCYLAGALAQGLVIAARGLNPTELAGQKMQALDVLSEVPFALMLPLALFVGVYEEILFRGFLLSRLITLLHLPRLTRRGATVAAVILSSGLFGLGHIYQGATGVVQTAAVGVVLCVVAVLRGNIWSCITAHAAIDAFGLLMLRLLKPMLQEVLKGAGSAADAGTP
ncbi:MAG TPA: CPBP family intramembrane glutamic endopeptidase, partial [Myxococcaceae bacterium]|nr:CPBP family intramembrane glutamic endopeptidase [Myxococcaceae bacterium]